MTLKFFYEEFPLFFYKKRRIPKFGASSIRVLNIKHIVFFEENQSYFKRKTTNIISRENKI